MMWPRGIRFSLRGMMVAIAVVAVYIWMFTTLFRDHFELMLFPISWGLGYLVLFVLPQVLLERWRSTAIEKPEPTDEL